MAKLLFNLRNVHDDEADEVRALLDDAGIAYYETTPSLWGISAGGIWLKQEADQARAKPLLADYQRQRGERARAEYAAARRDGSAETFWTALRAQPGRMLLNLLGILLALGLVALPVILLRW